MSEESRAAERQNLGAGVLGTNQLKGLQGRGGE